MKSQKTWTLIVIVLVAVGAWMLLKEDAQVTSASYPVEATINGNDVVISHDVLEETVLLKNQEQVDENVIEGKEPAFIIKYSDTEYSIYEVEDEGIVEYRMNDETIRYKIPGYHLSKFENTAEF